MPREALRCEACACQSLLPANTSCHRAQVGGADVRDGLNSLVDIYAHEAHTSCVASAAEPFAMRSRPACFFRPPAAVILDWILRVSPPRFAQARRRPAHPAGDRAPPHVRLRLHLPPPVVHPVDPADPPRVESRRGGARSSSFRARRRRAACLGRCQNVCSLPGELPTSVCS